MKIKHIWSVLCKESVISQDDNLISMHGVLEELSLNITQKSDSKKMPEKFNIPINYEIVSLWQKVNEKELLVAQIEYILIDPEGKELISKIQDMEILEKFKRYRSRMKIVGFPISKQGEYIFRVKLKDHDAKKFELVSELPLEVKIQTEEKS